MKLTLLFLLFPFISFSQKVSEDSMINKWLHSIINIEVSHPDNVRINNIMGNNSISNWADSAESIREMAPRYTGTAIFLQYHSKYYLLTARHVLINDNGFNKKNDSANIVDYIGLVNNLILSNNQLTIDTITLNGDALSGKILPNLSRPYHVLFSSKEDDLAVIRITTDGYDAYFGKQFLNVLNRRGYSPITISDIDTMCNISDNQKLLAIGFPSESVLGQENIPYYTMRSSSITAPAVSFGIINNSLKDSSFFEGSIFVYHGMSGGAAISNNKLIGVISRLPPTLEKTNSVYLNLYLKIHPYFSKASLIMNLLRKTESLPEPL